MKSNKKGNMSVSTIQDWTLKFVIVVVLFLLVAELLPEAQSAGNNISATGAPLTGLFSSDGVVILLIIAGLLLLVVNAFMKKGKK